MDLSNFIAPLISGVVAVIVCVLNNNAAMKKADIEQDKKLMEINASMQQSIAIISCKIDELDKKQAIHNSVIERVYKLENCASVMDEKMKVANNRIADLEHSATK